MQTLTREEAIKRIRDIRLVRSCDHLTCVDHMDEHIYEYYIKWGAIRELMAIFDIKEEEL